MCNIVVYEGGVSPSHAHHQIHCESHGHVCNSWCSEASAGNLPRFVVALFSNSFGDRAGWWEYDDHRAMLLENLESESHGMFKWLRKAHGLHWQSSLQVRVPCGTKAKKQYHSI